MNGQLQLHVQSTDKGTAIAGTHYKPFDKKFVMPDGATEVVLEFYWKPDMPITSSATISFDLKLIAGKGYVKTASAVLMIEPEKVGGTIGRKYNFRCV